MATSRSAVVWRYLFGRSVKHALRSRRDQGWASLTSALCGTSPLWYAPAAERWQDNTAELGRLPECGRCANLLAPKGESHVADQP